jgi:hypothetical protein
MARKKGEASEDKEAPKQTVEDLSDEDHQSLTFQHKASYQQKLAAKKKADADFKNACKLAKAELGPNAVADIKLAIELESEEGQTAVRERRAREARIARWMAADIGTQADFDFDGMSGTDRAFAEGKLAASKGERCKPPGHYQPGSPQYEFWINGHHQQSGIATIGRGAGAKIGSEKATHEVATH